MKNSYQTCPVFGISRSVYTMAAALTPKVELLKAMRSAKKATEMLELCFGIILIHELISMESLVLKLCDLV